MPVYKDEKRNTWFCKCNYKDWLGESKSKMKRGFATKKDALAIDDPVEYVRLMLSGEMQVWLDAVDDLRVWQEDKRE